MQFKLFIVFCLQYLICVNMSPYPPSPCFDHKTKGECIDHCNCRWCIFHENDICFDHLDQKPCSNHTSKPEKCTSSIFDFFSMLFWLSLSCFILMVVFGAIYSLIECRGYVFKKWMICEKINEWTLRCQRRNESERLWIDPEL